MMVLHPKTKEMGDPLSDCSPLISAASSGKLRLVRLLVEGGTQVNGRNARGETALLAACKALRGEPSGPHALRLITFLLQNKVSLQGAEDACAKADPNAQDRAGRTALMYACMNRAGAQVASALLTAGADPSLQDCSGASALVYAINAQHQSTLQVLMDTCRTRGREIIILATGAGANGDPVTRSCLNVPPSPDNSPVSCMSPSDIVLKAGSPKSPKGENIFNFRGTNKQGSCSNSRRQSSLSHCSTSALRQRKSSEPWLAIHNLARLSRDYEEGMKERSLKEEGDEQDLRKEGGGRKDEEEKLHFPQSGVEGGRQVEVQRRDDAHGGENYNSCREDFSLRGSQSVLSLSEMSSSHANLSSRVHKGGPRPRRPIWGEKLPACPSFHLQLRRNTLPSVTVLPPLLHPPPLNQSHSPPQVPGKSSLSNNRNIVSPPHPPTSSNPRLRPVILPPLPLTSSAAPLVAPPGNCCSNRGGKSLRRYSAQLE